jgi:hypothetical protein
MEGELPDWRKPVGPHKSKVQDLAIVVSKALFQYRILQDMERLQGLEQSKFPNQGREFDMDKDRNYHRISLRLHLSFRAQTCSLNLPVEIGWKQKKALMLEVKPIPAFRDATFSKNQTRLTSRDRIADDRPFFEGENPWLLFSAPRFPCS